MPPTMSSPMTMTVGASRIAWSIVALIDFLMLLLRAMSSSQSGISSSVCDVDVGQQLSRRRQRRRLRLDHRLLDQIQDLPVDLLELRLRDDAGLLDPGLEQLDAVLGGTDVFDLVLAAIGLRVSF